MELMHDFLRSPSATQPWVSFAKWLTQRDAVGNMHAVPPGFRDPDMDTQTALSVLRRRLKDDAMKDLRAGPGFWPRKATVRMKPRRSGQRPQDVSNLLMHTGVRSKPADTSHDCKANTIMWVALHETVVDIVDAQAIDELFTYGVLCVVTGVGFHHQTLTVAPHIAQLPFYCVNGRERATMQNVIDGTVLVTLALADFYLYNFVYSCFAVAALELGADDIGSTAPNCTASQIQLALQPPPRHLALRCWLGLARHEGACSASPQAATEIINIFGPAGERDGMISAAEQRLAPRKLVFTPAQRQDLQEFESSVVLFSGPAGNGKRQRIIALLTHVLAQHAVASDSVLCIYATPTKKMAEEFQNQLVEAMSSSEGIVMLGVDATGSTDHFEEHIRKEARDLSEDERACVSAVDFIESLAAPSWRDLASGERKLR